MGCSEGLDAFRFFFSTTEIYLMSMYVTSFFLANNICSEVTMENRRRNNGLLCFTVHSSSQIPRTPPPPRPTHQSLFFPLTRRHTNNPTRLQHNLGYYSESGATVSGHRRLIGPCERRLCRASCYQFSSWRVPYPSFMSPQSTTRWVLS